MNHDERELMRVSLAVQRFADRLEELFGGGPGCAELVSDMRTLAYESAEYVIDTASETVENG